MVKRLWMAMALVTAACAPPAPPRATAAAGPVTLTELWSTPGLSSPESIAPAPDGAFLYVSNVNGGDSAKDGNGFITRLRPDGGIDTLQWAKGLDGPKGLAVHDGRLWVADIDQLVALDAESGAELARHPAPGAKFLNDAAVSADGLVLVTDSATARIYALQDDALTVWLEGAALDSVNGLWPEPDRLVVSTMKGKLLAVDWTTKAITELAHDLGDADGIAPLGDGAYLVSDWTGRLFEVAADGKATVLLDTHATKTLLNDILLVRDTLYVPNWEPGSVTAYKVVR